MQSSCKETPYRADNEIPPKPRAKQDAAWKIPKYFPCYCFGIELFAHIDTINTKQLNSDTAIDTLIVEVNKAKAVVKLFMKGTNIANGIASTQLIIIDHLIPNYYFKQGFKKL